MFGIFGGSKNEAHFGDFLGPQGWGDDYCCGLSSPFRGRVGMPLGYGNGKQAEYLARPGPEGGRIEPAEPEPPPALFICKVGKGR